MQHGAPYIGRHFKLTRAHHMDDKKSLTPGSIGSLKAVDEQNATMLLIFSSPVDGGCNIYAWIPEAIVSLVDDTKTEQSPAEAPPTAETKTGLPEGYEAVKSSNIKAICYRKHEGGTGTLEVLFTNNTRYAYPGVPELTYKEILESTSFGKTFNALVKTAKDEKDSLIYRSEKLADFKPEA